MTPRELWARTFGRLRRGGPEEELQEEIAAHLEIAIEEYRRQGMSDEEARRAAAVHFGTIDGTTEQVRDQSGLPMIDGPLRDVRHAVPGLLRSPGFTLVAAATLALGIGLCSAFFSVMNGAILRPLANVDDPHRLFATEQKVSYPYFRAFAEEEGIGSQMAIWIGPTRFNVAPQGPDDVTPGRVLGHIVSPEYFSTIGVKPSLGRFFNASGNEDLDARSVVVSDRFWRARFGGDPDAVGNGLLVNGHRVTIIGVGPAEFHGVFPAAPAEIFVPAAAGPELAPELDGGLDDAALEHFRVLLRLERGEEASAGAALDTIARRLDDQLVEPRDERDKKSRRISLVPAGSQVMASAQQRSFVTAFYIVLIGLILVLTCASLAGLVLTRGGARGKEVAIRLSLGASRLHLIRQLLTESAVLALIGGTAGLGAAFVMLEALTRYVASSTRAGATGPSHISPDLTVVLLTLAVSVAAVLGFGLLPALGSTRPNVVAALKGDVSGGQRRYKRFGVRNLFVVAQVAASMSLILVVGTLVVGARQGATADPGFDVSSIQVFSLDPRRNGLSAEESERVPQAVADRLRTLPGVEAVTFARTRPLALTPQTVRAVVASDSDGDEIASVQRRIVGPEYFSTLGVTVLRGVDLDPSGSLSSNTVQPAVISAEAATTLFGEEDPLGRSVEVSGDSLEIVGVVRYGAPQPFSGKPPSIVFTRMSPDALPRGVAMVVRSSGGLDVAAVDRALDQVDSRLALFDLARLDTDASGFERTRDSMAALNTGVGVFALILACIGLAGVTSQAVERRRKEIGIEMALGAGRVHLLRSVMKEGIAMVAVGAVLGWAIAFALSRALIAMESTMTQIVEAGSEGLWLPVGVPVLLVTLALAACYLPARRAIALDPLTALRTD